MFHEIMGNVYKKNPLRVSRLINTSSAVTKWTRPSKEIDLRPELHAKTFFDCVLHGMA